MECKEVIEKRRAYRSLKPVEITEEMVTQLSKAIQIAPSCFNNQPWRYVFIREKNQLDTIFTAIAKGNEWAQHASMVVAVCSSVDDDCVIRDREYFLFDTGIASAQLIITATDLGLVAHPIAGFSPKKVREILTIPDDVKVIALIIIGRKNETINPELSDKQIGSESERPTRKNISEIISHEQWDFDR